MNEPRYEKPKQATWTEEVQGFEDRITNLKAISIGLPNFEVVGGELDELPSGYAASILFKVGGSVLCITAHSLTCARAQVLVYQGLALWMRFTENETA